LWRFIILPGSSAIRVYMKAGTTKPLLTLGINQIMFADRWLHYRHEKRFYRNEPDHTDYGITDAERDIIQALPDVQLREIAKRLPLHYRRNLEEGL